MAEGPKNYGWIIDEVHVEGLSEEVGTCGPFNAAEEILDRLRNSDEGRKFRMLDGDGELDYVGRIITPDTVGSGSSLDFSPLDHFGRPNVGSASIEYLINGKWEEL
ncbi:hypothetical protein [Rhodococcus qingshengii]|uniref:hypothetical protein n=1 Tax=Rhodococcus qingshengii TaxID=334542 RepID=UPI0035DD5697